MSKRSVAAGVPKTSPDGAPDEFSIRAAHAAHPPKRRPWLLGLSAVLLVVWIAVLSWMALR